LTRPKQCKKDTRFGTWSVRNLYRVGAIKSVVGELEKYKLDSVGVHEVRNSRDSSVSTALCYGLDDRGSRVRFLVGAGNISLQHHVQNGSGAHTASYPMDTRGSFPGGIAVGT
jgi:hypothetical protein